MAKACLSIQTQVLMMMPNATYLYARIAKCFWMYVSITGRKWKYLMSRSRLMMNTWERQVWQNSVEASNLPQKETTLDSSRDGKLQVFFSSVSRGGKTAIPGMYFWHVCSTANNPGLSFQTWDSFVNTDSDLLSSQ